MDGITVVRELASENKHGSDLVLDGLNELTDNNKQLQNHASSSLDMTTDINSQVENVAGLIMRWYLLQLNQVPMPRQVQPTLRVL